MRTATRFFRPRERQRYRWLFCFPKVFASSLADVHATDRFNTLVETVTPPWRAGQSKTKNRQHKRGNHGMLLGACRIDPLRSSHVGRTAAV
jgi:hypothetical protein